MTGKQNKGITMVEIMIAIAVFAILLIPIIGGLISSMNSSTQAKEIQYRNDYAEDLLEYIKTDSINNILTGDYMKTNGSTDVSTAKTTYWNYSGDSWISEGAPGFLEAYKTNAVTNQPNLSYDSYEIKGQVRLGTKHTLYSYVVAIDNKYYANQATKDENNDGKVDGDDVKDDRNGDGILDEKDVYSDPNSLRLGIVEDLDKTKVAVFDGKVLANRDATVMAEFQSRIVSAMRENNPDRYKTYMSQATGYDFTDQVTRIARVQVSGNAADGYTVSLILDYIDDDPDLSSSGALDLSTNYISQPIDTLYYEDELPNIYLMYNPCTYNGYYMPDDYIVFDCTEVTDDTEVTAFVVESAEKYSQNIADTMSDKNVTNIDGKTATDTRVYTRQTPTGQVINRDAVNIHLIAMEKDQNISNDVNGFPSVSRLKVYHNFSNTVDEAGNILNANKKNTNVWYTSAGTNPVDSFINDFNSKVVADKSAVPLIYAGEPTKSATVGFLDTANEEKRGLYQVQIWMQEGDVTVDTTKPPILQGSKGGGES